jgi:hypothetical protein
MPALTPDEQRALNWQVARRARRAFKRSLQAKLKAPVGNQVTLEENWEPLISTSSAGGKYEWEDENG